MQLFNTRSRDDNVHLKRQRHVVADVIQLECHSHSSSSQHTFNHVENLHTHTHIYTHKWWTKRQMISLIYHRMCFLWSLQSAERCVLPSNPIESYVTAVCVCCIFHAHTYTEIRIGYKI